MFPAVDVAVAWLSAIAFFGLSGVLLAVGLVSWRRTERMRRGRPLVRAPPGSGGPSSTSRLTWLAAWAGASATTWGITVAGTHEGAGLALVAGGAFVAVTGARGRVTSIQADRDGLTVCSSGGRPFVLSWPDVEVVRPPRTPLGGWRVQGRIGARTLMPSDLWGSEAVLPLVTRSAGLRFDGHRWRRPSGR
jgi:hypothetical protein